MNSARQKLELLLRGNLLMFVACCYYFLTCIRNGLHAGLLVIYHPWSNEQVLFCMETVPFFIRK